MSEPPKIDLKYKNLAPVERTYCVSLIDPEKNLNVFDVHVTFSKEKPNFP